MDYLAHGLWSYIIFHKIKKVWYAIFFGLLPDTFSWAIYLIYSLFINGLKFGKPIVAEIPNWVLMLYNISHSIFVAAAVIIIVSLFMNKFLIYMLGWSFHIGIDIFSHSRSFLPTPFLWPLSEWKFDGISWGNPKFMIINYVLITLGLIYIYLKKRESYKKK